jgi:hypothetical protein
LNFQQAKSGKLHKTTCIFVFLYKFNI